MTDADALLAAREKLLVASAAVEAAIAEKVRNPDTQRMAAAHAPKGGVTVAGKDFTGGEFIPGDVMAKATTAEKAAVEGGPAFAPSFDPDDFHPKHVTSVRPAGDAGHGIEFQAGTANVGKGPFLVYRWVDADKNVTGDWMQDKKKAAKQAWDWADRKEAAKEVARKDAGSLFLPDSVTRSKHLISQPIPPQADPSQLDAVGQKALAAYSGQFYRGVNKALRSGMAAGPRVTKLADQLQSSFANLKPFDKPLRVFRGIAATKAMAPTLAAFDAANGAAEKPIVTLKGFTSTSLNPDVSNSFGEGQVVLEVVAKKGVHMEPVTNVKGEHEVLLPHAARYRVHGTKRVPFQSAGGNRFERTVIQLEQLLDDEP